MTTVPNNTNKDIDIIANALISKATYNYMSYDFLITGLKDDALVKLINDCLDNDLFKFFVLNKIGYSIVDFKTKSLDYSDILKSLNVNERKYESYKKEFIMFGTNFTNSFRNSYLTAVSENFSKDSNEYVGATKYSEYIRSDISKFTEL